MSLLVAFLVNSGAAVEVTQMQSRDAFLAALRNPTTSPSYVMFTAVDAETGERRIVCSVSMWLIVAIQREQELEPQGSVKERAGDIALSNHSRVFRFHEGSLEHSRINTAEGLDAARNYLAGLSAEEIRDRFGSKGKSRIYNKDAATDSAFACALIERGFTPRSADIGGYLYIER